jgi:hypothetical protein
MELSDQFHVPATFRQGIVRRDPEVGGWIGLRVSLDNTEDKSNLQTVTRRYTDWVTP